MSAKKLRKLKTIRKCILACVIFIPFRLIESNQQPLKSKEPLEKTQSPPECSRDTNNSSRPQIVQTSIKRILQTASGTSPPFESTRYQPESPALLAITEPVFGEYNSRNTYPNYTNSFAPISRGRNANDVFSPQYFSPNKQVIPSSTTHEISENINDTMSSSTMINNVMFQKTSPLIQVGSGSNSWLPVDRKVVNESPRIPQNNFMAVRSVSWPRNQVQTSRGNGLDLFDLNRYIYLNQMKPRVSGISIGQSPSQWKSEGLLSKTQMKIKDLLPSGNWPSPSIMDTHIPIWPQSVPQVSDQMSAFNSYQPDKPWTFSNWSPVGSNQNEASQDPATISPQSEDPMNPQAPASATNSGENLELTYDQLNNALQAITSKTFNQNTGSSTTPTPVDDRELLNYLGMILKNEIANQEKIRSSSQNRSKVASESHQNYQTVMMSPNIGQNTNWASKFPPFRNPAQGENQNQMTVLQQDPSAIKQNSMMHSNHLMPGGSMNSPNVTQPIYYPYFEPISEFNPTTNRYRGAKKDQGKKGTKRNTKKSSRPLIQVNRNPYMSDGSQLHEINSHQDLQTSPTFLKWKRPFYDEDDGEEGETEVNIRFFNNFSRMGPLSGIARAGGAVALVASLAFLILSNVSLATTLIAHGIYNFLKNTSDDPIHRNRFLRPFDKFIKNRLANSTNSTTIGKIIKISTTEAPIRALDQSIQSLGDIWK